jgi:hypothetical protein
VRGARLTAAARLKPEWAAAFCRRLSFPSDVDLIEVIAVQQ